MRTTPLTLAASIVAATLVVATGCQTTQPSEEPTRASEPDSPRVASESLESRLANVKPHLRSTMEALNGVIANSSTPALGDAHRHFVHELNQLRHAADRVIADLDEQRRRSDAFFLERDRTDSNTGQPGVLEGRDRVGLVGEYLVQLRGDYQKLRTALDSVETKLGANPTAAGVDAAMPDIARAQRHEINVANDIDVLLAEIRRVRFGE